MSKPRKEQKGKAEKLNSIKSMLESSLSPKKTSYTNTLHGNTTSNTSNLSGFCTNFSSFPKATYDQRKLKVCKRL